MKRKKRRTVLWLCAVPVLLAAVACDSRLALRYYTVTAEQMTRTVRLAVLTDLHSCVYGQGQRELLTAVAEQSPDAVLLVGDIVDDKLPEGPAWTAMTALAAEYPCYYVTGNHEWWSGHGEDICAAMETLGITVLRGQTASLTVGGDTLTFFGIDDPDGGEEGQLARAASLPEDAFTVLLAHRPERIEAYLQYPFDLIVSGHAHGGQWRIPGLVNGLLAPHQGLFPKYAGGRYDFPGTVFLVSRGLARESTSIPRVFNRPELVILDISPGAQ